MKEFRDKDLIADPAGIRIGLEGGDCEEGCAAATDVGELIPVASGGGAQ